MECDVIIIEAGPTGLFAAAELVNNLKIVIIDKGRGMDVGKWAALKKWNL